MKNPNHVLLLINVDLLHCDIVHEHWIEAQALFPLEVATKCFARFSMEIALELEVNPIETCS